MKTVYLASPYGFSEQQKTLLEPIEAALRSLGLAVLEPFKHAPGLGPYNIGRGCVKAVQDADAFFAVVNGCPPDEGVMVELGIAIALCKPIFLFRDDFRRCSDNVEYPLNLMVFAGLPREGWRNSFHRSVQDIPRPDMALAKWAKGCDRTCPWCTVRP
jgi:nucleoside 2-deoxyribosyltransferase